MLTLGILTRKVAMIPLIKVTDMRYDRPPIGQILGYGSFVLESAGQDQAFRVVHFVPHPDIALPPHQRGAVHARARPGSWTDRRPARRSFRCRSPATPGGSEPDPPPVSRRRSRRPAVRRRGLGRVERGRLLRRRGAPAHRRREPPAVVVPVGRSG